MRSEKTQAIKLIEDFIDEYHDMYGSSPSIMDIEAGTGLSKSAIGRYLICMRENGLVEYDEDKCAACYMCVMSCRYGVPAISPDRKRMIKCDFCVHLEEGPACVRACPKKAIEVREV